MLICSTTFCCSTPHCHDRERGPDSCLKRVAFHQHFLHICPAVVSGSSFSPPEMCLSRCQITQSVAQQAQCRFT